LLASDFQAITHPDDLEIDLAHMRQLLAGATPTFQLEKRYLHKRGHILWVLLSASLVRDSQGRPLHLLSQIHDITERKQAESALRESEARYRYLFEESTVALWEADMSRVRQRFDEWGRQGVANLRAFFESQPGMLAEIASLVSLTDMNRAALALYGAASKAEFGQSLDRILGGNSYDGLLSQLAALADGRTEFEWEGPIHTLPGDRLTVYLRCSVVRGYEASLSKVIISITDITERKRAEERLQYAAFHDALTGLPNRALFFDRLGHVLQRQRRRRDAGFAVLFLDFDRFKVVNDSLGHLVGDQLLIAAAQRLAACVRSLDTVARLGGDEFVVLLEDLAGPDSATAVADRIQHALQQPFELNGHSIFISSSIGIVLSDTAPDRPEDILRDADAAMYRAKARGKARYEVFHDEMRTDALARLQLETDLRRAIEQEEFRVYYQPIVALESGRVTGFEALARWQHPELGLLLPGAFMAVAEDTGLIVPIGEWLLRAACRQLAAWQAQFPADPPLTVSVNLSSRQVAQPELDALVAAVLAETGIAPHSLRLEITERTIIDENPTTAGVLARLKALGVQLEIDDFGTGYSALSYLQRLQWDALKIDRSFIKQLSLEGSHGAVVRTILALGHSLDLHIIAEGVESPEQLARLQALGCHTGQGFLFGRPVEPDEAVSLLEKPETNSVKRET
jgi:diguanylate cyclase (GGDEF)-like protein/PAS domain S-box-containing protein